MARNPQNAVLICTGPPNWLPKRFHELPPEILAAEYYSKRLPMRQALIVAREFNRAHSPESGKFTGQWAVVLRGLRKFHIYNPPGNGAAPHGAESQGGDA